MRKKLFISIGIILLIIIGYFSILYVQDLQFKEELREKDKALRESYERVKRDVKNIQLGIPEVIEFEDFDSAQIVKNTNGEAYIEFWVRYIEMKSINPNYDTIRFSYYINTDGKIRFERKIK